jgi:DNA-binding response OmpR family regulator
VKILLVDDEEALLAAIKRALVHQGHEVDATSDPAQGAKMGESGDYDFALVDFMMPLHNGIWFMKNAHLPKKTKVLLLTAHVNRDVINEMFKLGARGYLIKPIDPEDLAHHLAFHSRNQAPVQSESVNRSGDHPEDPPS